MLQSQCWIPWMWNSIPTWLHFQQKQPTSLWSWQAHHWETIQRPSLPLCRMYATLACLQHGCQYPLCSLQTCKSLYLPWWSQFLCSYLAHRLPTKAPILCHQILPRHHFQPCLQCMPPSPHTTLQLDRIFLMPAGKIALTLAALPLDIWFFTMVLSSKSILPCPHQLLCQPSKPNTWLPSQRGKKWVDILVVNNNCLWSL